MRSIILSTAAICLATGASAEGLTIKPGQWTYTTDVSMALNGQALPTPEQDNTMSECISEADATLNPSDVTQEGCEVSEVVRTGNQLSFALTCSQNGMIVAGGMNISKNAEGTQTSGNFNMTGTGQGMTMKITGKIKGERTGDC